MRSWEHGVNEKANSTYFVGLEPAKFYCYGTCFDVHAEVIYILTYLFTFQIKSQVPLSRLDNTKYVVVNLSGIECFAGFAASCDPELHHPLAHRYRDHLRPLQAQAQDQTEHQPFPHLPQVTVPILTPITRMKSIGWGFLKSGSRKVK